MHLHLMNNESNKKSGFNFLLRAFFLMAAATNSLAEPPVPDYANIQYGTDAKCVLDFWKAPSAIPTAVVIYIHGGGFRSGDKSEAIHHAAIEQYLKAGISVASINYRIRPAPVPDILRDCARAVQFIRHKSAEWNVDKKRIGVCGGSAGGCAALWLAFHSDLADASNPDPVLRESTRPACAAAFNFQYTLDLVSLESFFTGKGVVIPQQFRMSMDVPGYYGLKNEEELNSPAGQKLRADCDLPNLITKDAPPVFLECMENGGIGNDFNQLIHHPMHAEAMKKSCDKIGIVAIAKIPAFGISPAAQQPATIEQFFLKYLSSPAP